MADTDLDFDKAFDELSKMKDDAPTASLTPVPETPPVVVGDPPADAPVADTPADTPPAEAPVADTPADTPPVDAPAAPPQMTDDEILSRFAQAVAKHQPAPQRPEPQPVQHQPTPQEAPQLYTKEEQDLITSYEKDWPDVAKAEAVRRRGEYQQLLNYIFKEVSDRLAPMEQLINGTAKRDHVTDLYDLIPDYDQVRDPVIDWVGKQPPGIMRSAYEHIVQQGSPAEIGSLVDAWRLSTGAVAPQAAPPVVPAAPPVPAQPKPEVRRAAAALAPVQSTRSAGGIQAEPADFDSAFAAFAKTV